MPIQMSAKWFFAALGSLLLAGCASTQATRAGAAPEAGTESIPRLTALYNKANDVHVNRFRKPYRDERVRVLHDMSTECERLLAETKTWDSSARLTAAGPAKRDEIRSNVASFRSSLEELRSAADKADLHGVDAAYSDALTAYARIQRGLATSAP